MKKARQRIPKAAEPAASYGEPKVRIADLKAHLSQHLRLVRAGGSFTIMDRDTPIARVEPIRLERPRLVIHPPTGTWAEVVAAAAKVKPVTFDPVKILLELRKDRV